MIAVNEKNRRLVTPESNSGIGHSQDTNDSISQRPLMSAQFSLRWRTTNKDYLHGFDFMQLWKLLKLLFLPVKLEA